MADWTLRHAWPLLVGVALKSLLLLALASLAAAALRRASAAARHLVWRLALLGLLALPALSLMPAIWRVPLGPPSALAVKELPVVIPTPPSPAGNGGGAKAASTPSPSPPSLGAGEAALPARPAASPAPWPVWACGLWLLGTVLALLPLLAGLIGIRQLERRSERLPDGPLLPELAREMGVQQPVALRSGDVSTPMTWGWTRPTILLPIGAEGWPEGRLRAVLLHELAHIARADWPAQVASQAACALYWFNPAVWLAARCARTESERACDDRVLLAGVPAPDYARHLLDVARAINAKTLPAVLPMVHTTNLEARLRALLERTRRRNAVSERLLKRVNPVVWLAVYALGLVAAAVPPPPDHSTRLDGPSYAIIKQANAATAALHSLQADIHATTRFTYRREVDQMDGTLTFQRPNLARIEVPGDAGFTFASDGSNDWLVDHAPVKYFHSAVGADGADMTTDDESDVFLQYFFQPDFYRLGVDEVEVPSEDYFLLGTKTPIPVTGRSLGVRTWQGSQYQVVEFTRQVVLHTVPLYDVTTVYVGPDHLVHRIVGKVYFDTGVRTDDISLTNIQVNRTLPKSAFAYTLPKGATPHHT